jgi:hypothetical protein
LKLSAGAEAEVLEIKEIFALSSLRSPKANIFVEEQRLGPEMKVRSSATSLVVRVARKLRLV